MRAARRSNRTVLSAASIAIAFVSANVLIQPAIAAITETKVNSETETPIVTPSSDVKEEPPPTMADPMADRPTETPKVTSADLKTIPAASTAAPAKPADKTSAKPVSQLDQLKALYRAGKYRDALALISKMKQSEVTHYYTGLCYQGQGQLAQAAQQFSFTASIARDPKIKYNAQVAQRAVASYASNRTYKGQGNFFAKTVAAPRSSGGASGAGGCGPRRA